MKLKLKENPKEWRKAAWFGALGVAIFSSLLRWRHKLPVTAWILVLGGLAVIALGAFLQPRWFRGWYRFSGRLGFYISQFVGLVIFAVLFVLVLTPLGLVLRWSGKDFLRLKRDAKAASYWDEVKEGRPLDQIF